METERSVDGQRTMIVVDGRPDPSRRIPSARCCSPTKSRRRRSADAAWKPPWSTSMRGVRGLRSGADTGPDGSVAALVSADVPVVRLRRRQRPEKRGDRDLHGAHRLCCDPPHADGDRRGHGLADRPAQPPLPARAGLGGARAGGHPGFRASLLFVDVDRFKSVNDQFGHSAGDEVLRTVAQLVVGSVRRIDVAARYGGDEFAVALIGAGRDEAMDVAERIRAAVEGAHLLGPAGQVTVSVGVATFPGHAGTKAELLEKADWAMYLAKRSGPKPLCALRRRRGTHDGPEAGDSELTGLPGRDGAAGRAPGAVPAGALGGRRRSWRRQWPCRWGWSGRGGGRSQRRPGCATSASCRSRTTCCARRDR